MNDQIPRLNLSEGGFAPGTRLVTPNGPDLVDELTAGDSIYTLDATTALVKPRRLAAVEPVSISGELVRICGKRVDLLVHPEQRIPFQTKAIDRIRFQRADQLNERQYYKFVNEWEVLSQRSSDIVDVTEYLDSYQIRARSEDHGHTFRARLPEACLPVRRNSHTGYYFDAATFKQYQSELEAAADELTIVGGRHQRGRPYRFSTTDFVQFLGWFLTEGSVTQSKKRDTASVQIAQQKLRNRRTIRQLLDRMGFEVSVNDRGFRFGSKLYAEFLTSLCGSESTKRKLPALVWTLSTDQQRLLLETMIRGDGNRRNTYYTASDQLARGLCRLSIHLGMKPRYQRRNGIWILYFNTPNDGFDSSIHVSTVASEGVAYRLTAEDNSIVMAGRDGKFQWCGLSSVC